MLAMDLSQVIDFYRRYSCNTVNERSSPLIPVQLAYGPLLRCFDVLSMAADTTKDSQVGYTAGRTNWYVPWNEFAAPV